MIYYYRTKDIEDFKDFVFFLEAKVDFYISTEYYNTGDLIVFDDILNELRWSDADLFTYNKVELTKKEMLSKLILEEL